jgi:hypothetical protein
MRRLPTVAPQPRQQPQQHHTAARQRQHDPSTSSAHLVAARRQAR